MIDFLDIAFFVQQDTLEKPAWQDRSDDNYFEFVSGDSHAKIFKRKSYPKTFAFVDSTRLVCGYGDTSLLPIVELGNPMQIDEFVFLNNEFLFIVIDLATKKVTIQCDGINTVPVFVGSQQDRIVVTNDFYRTYSLMDSSKLFLDRSCVAEYLLRYRTFEKTFIKSIQLLYDRKCLEWISGKTQILLPPDASMKNNYKVRLSNPKDFSFVFQQVVTDYWQKYIGNDRAVASDVSCGLDSTTLTTSLSKLSNNLITLTVLFSGNFRATQQRKLRDLQEVFSFKPLISYSEESLDYPWMEVLEGKIEKPFYHNHSTPYRTPFNELYEALATHYNVDTFFSGVGGDELFDNVDHAIVMGRSDQMEQEQTHFDGLKLAQQMLKHSRNSSKSTRQPIPLMAYSALSIPSRIGGIYLDYGLWFVRPMSDPKLYAFTQTVPLQYCVDKVLLRVYAVANGVPKSIAFPDENESFSNQIHDNILRLHKIISFSFENSLLESFGFVEIPPFKKLLSQVLNGHGDTDTCLMLKRFLHAELNLRSLESLKFQE